MESPLEPSEGTSPTDTLTLAQWNPCQASYLQNCKIIYLYYFKALICGNLLQQQQKTLEHFFLILRECIPSTLTTSYVTSSNTPSHLHVSPTPWKNIFGGLEESYQGKGKRKGKGETTVKF